MRVVKTGRCSAAFRRTAMAMLLAASFSTAFAAEPVVLDIPAQDMAAALKSLSRQANVQILFPADLVQGKQSKPLKGSYTAGEALRMLLKDSNLNFAEDGAGTFAVHPQAGRTAEEPQSFLNEVTVTATRIERPVDEVPASVSVLTAKKLASKNCQNVYEALRDEEGLDFVTPPGVAHQVFPTIRGVGGSFAGSTTQVLVDGIAHDSVSSNLMGHGGLNFTSMQDVERVEVLRGPASALYGYGAIGGVINVIPKRWMGEAGAEANASYGTHNTQQLGVVMGTAKENFDVRLSVYDARSDGFVAVPIPDPFGGLDAGPRDWKDSKIGLMAGFRPADNQEFTLDLQQYGTRSAGNYGGRPNDRQNMDGQSATLGYRYDLSDTANIKATLRTVHLRQAFFFDSGDWNGLAVAGAVTAADLPLAYFGGRTTNATKFQVQMDTQPFAGNQLIVGYGHDAGDYQTEGAMVGFATRVSGSKDKVDALFVQDEHKVGAVTLTGGVRYDRLNFSPDTVNGVPKNGSASTDNVVNPRLGVRFHLNDATSFYASAGTAYLPALNTFKFVQPSAIRVDNPNIKPETSTSYELGMNNTLGIGKLRTSIFHTDYKDKITLGTDPVTAKGQWQNIAFVKVDGIEFSYQGEIGSGWKPYANFSYTKARDYAKAGAAGTQSLRIAPRKFNLGVTYEPNSTWSATLNGRAVSDMYFNKLTAAQHTGGYFIADAKVTARLPVEGNKCDAFFAVNNLGGKKYQPFNIGEWSDGRTLTVGLNGRF